MPESKGTDRYQQLTAILVDARKKKGLSQAALAERLGKGQTYVSKYERGDRRLDVIQFLEIADALRISPYKVIRQIRSIDG